MVEKIRKLAQAKGISITALETELGLGNGTIGKWRNSSPTAENLKKVARFFDVTIDELMDDQETE